MSKHQGHVAKKRFGQHFLSDTLTIGAIVDLIAPDQDDQVVEIGPGLGALTLPLLGQLARMTVIELDRDLAAQLTKNPKLKVIQQDVLRVDFGAIGLDSELPLRIVGNLPYNISTPILFHLIPFARRIKDQHFMLQKEVVDRMVAPVGCAAYGRLSVMLQARYMMDRLLSIGPACFTPPPRVHSAIVRMVPLADCVWNDGKTYAHLEEMVRVAFSQRRKLLRHTLGPWLDHHGFGGAFELKRRAEEVSVSEYLNLAEATLSSTGNGRPFA